MHFSQNNLDAKFVSNDGATMDHFSIDKTAKKKVIERISDDTATDTNVIEVSDKETTKAKPLAEQAKVQDAKPSITFKLDEDAKAANTKAKPLVEQAEVQEDKPAITTKLDDNSPTDDKPMSLRIEKVDSNDKDKSKSFQSIDNVDKSHVQDVLGTLVNDSPIDDEVSDSDEEKTFDTNIRDPFAAVN